MPLDYKRLSKTIAVALRHDPDRFGLTLDSEGWTPVEALLAALRQLRREWRDLTENDLADLIAQSAKKRYELRDGSIRAYYGHSFDEKIEKTPAEPPDTLFHGTSPDAAAVILAEGLKPMSRQYVHLSTDRQTAQMVGSRHTAAPVILIVQARAAYQSGVAFYLGNEDIWLANEIPPQFIKTS
jgi:putative RNA 2'-phosphotransferase